MFKVPTLFTLTIYLNYMHPLVESTEFGLLAMAKISAFACTTTKQVTKTLHLYLILQLNILSFSVRALKPTAFLVVLLLQSKQLALLVMSQVTSPQLLN